MIYLDYAATTPIESEILIAYNELLQKYYANAASNHPLGAISDSLQTRARQQIASYFNVDCKEVIFTSGASEANNLAIKGVAFKYLNRGKHIITSLSEHPSVLNACQQLENQFGFTVTYLNVNQQGKISLNELKSALKKDTILVSIMSVNNEVGSINDIENIYNIIKTYSNAFYHCDMTQSIGKVELDLTKADLISCSAHKIHGLKGSGFLIKRKPIELTALISGGGQEFGYRSGTSNWPVNVILAKTLRLALDHQKQNYEYVSSLNQLLKKQIAQLPHVIINSPDDASPYIFNFSITEQKASVVVQALEEAKICVSTLSACSSKIDKPSTVVLGMYNDYQRAISTIRVSLSKKTTKQEIDYFINQLSDIMEKLK